MGTKFGLQAVSNSLDITCLIAFALFMIDIKIHSSDLGLVVTFGFACTIFAQVLTVLDLSILIQALMCLINMVATALFFFASGKLFKNKVKSRLRGDENKTYMHQWDYYIWSTAQ